MYSFEDEGYVGEELTGGLWPQTPTAWFASEMPTALAPRFGPFSLDGICIVTTTALTAPAAEHVRTPTQQGSLLSALWVFVALNSLYCGLDG